MIHPYIRHNWAVFWMDEARKAKEKLREEMKAKFLNADTDLLVSDDTVERGIE